MQIRTASPSRSISILEAQLLASAGSDAALDAARAKLGVRVRDALESSGGGRVGGASEGDVADDGVADSVAVGRVDCLGAAVLEDGRLNQQLGAHAGVDAGVDGVEVAAVFGEFIYVVSHRDDRAEADRRKASGKGNSGCHCT